MRVAEGLPGHMRDTFGFLRGQQLLVALSVAVESRDLLGTGFGLRVAKQLVFDTVGLFRISAVWPKARCAK